MDSARDLRLLVVEDSDEDFESLVRAFSKQEPRVKLDRCVDGDEAMDYLFARGDYAGVPRPSIVILDLNLPGTDGREVLEMVKGDRALRVIPVLVFTTSHAQDDVQHAYRTGANSYMFKPRTPDEFTRVAAAVTTFWLDSAILPAPSESP